MLKELKEYTLYTGILVEQKFESGYLPVAWFVVESEVKEYRKMCRAKKWHTRVRKFAIR